MSHTDNLINLTDRVSKADKSAYWTPQLYYLHSSGIYEEVPNSGMAVYYLGRGAGARGSTAIPFPPGLRMLSGNTFARSYNATAKTWGDRDNPNRPLADRVSFVCINYDNPIPESYGMVNTTCPQGLRAQSMSCQLIPELPQLLCEIIH